MLKKSMSLYLERAIHGPKIFLATNEID